MIYSLIAWDGGCVGAGERAVSRRPVTRSLQLPLADRSVHVAVFCLSLMGTNVADFIAEANRVLKKK